MAEIKPRKLPEIKERNVGNEMMLYDVAGKTIHVLNNTASFVWTCCDGNHTTDDMVKKATGAFNITEDQANTDIEECLASFRELNIIQDAS